MQVPENQWDAVKDVHRWTVERMRDIRLARGYTQDHLAKLLGHKGAGSRVSDFETSRNDWKGSTLLRHARFLGVNMDRVFAGCPKWRDKRPDAVVIVSRDDLMSILSKHVNDNKAEQILGEISWLNEHAGMHLNGS